MLLAAQVLGVGTLTNAEVRDGEQPTADLPELPSAALRMVLRAGP